MNYWSVHLHLNGKESMRKSHIKNIAMIFHKVIFSQQFSGANLTHVVVLKPKLSGISNSSHAIVTYQKSEKNTDVQVREYEEKIL